MATTSRPACANSYATMEPVHPNPTIATSFGGNLRAMYDSALARVPVIASGDADGRVGIALIVAPDPIAVVIPRARKADHLPCSHFMVATVDRIREESLLHILQHLLEEGRPLHAL